MWKEKHAVAVMPTYSVSHCHAHCHVHVCQDNQYQETIHLKEINTHKYIHNTCTYIHNTCIHFCFCIVFVLYTLSVFACLLLVYVLCVLHVLVNAYQYMQYTQYKPIVCNPQYSPQTRSLQPPIQTSACKYMPKTCKKHANIPILGPCRLRVSGTSC